MKRISIVSTLMLSFCALFAQKDKLHLDIAATVGTTGFGVELAMPINQNVSVRGGFAIIPYFKNKMTLDVQLKDQPNQHVFNEEGYRTDHMGRVEELIRSFAGLELEETIDCYIRPKMMNGKILVDWSPFQQKSFHFTAGLYMGPSEVGDIQNYEASSSTIVGMGMYNGIYDRTLQGDPIITIGGSSVALPDQYREKVKNYGRVTIPAGYHMDGTSYSFDPGKDGIVHASIETNWIRPYVGAGWTFKLGQKQRNMISLDFGCLIWGGTPHIYTSDGTDLSHDVENIQGELGDWVRGISTLQVFPVCELRFIRRIF